VVALFGHHSIGNSGFEPHYIATTHAYTGYSRILFGYHQRIFYNHINIKTKNKNKDIMKPLVSIIMGSTSDLPIMEKACKWLEQYEIPFEVNALSAHRTPAAVEKFAKEAKERGIKVIIAGAGMAAGLPGGIAGSTKVGQWCMFGGQVGIAGHITIGDKVFLGAQSGVPGSLKSNQQLIGTPPMEQRPYFKSQAIFQRLPEMYKQLNALQKEIEELKKNK